MKKRKLILPDPDYVSSGIPAPLASEVDSLFEEPVNGDTDGDVENGIFPMNANPSSANPVNLPTYSSDSTPSTNSNLIPTHSKLPQLYWKLIPYEFFNRIQSATVDTLLSSDANVVVSAPTVTSPLPSLP